jgi:hypothetical protein
MKIITEKRIIEIEAPTNVILSRNGIDETYIFIDGNWEKLIKIEYKKEKDDEEI